MWTHTDIRVTEGSVTEPVTLDDVKDWIGVDFNDHDGILTSMIKGARQSIENYCWISLVPKTVVVDFEVSEDTDRVPLPYTSSFSGLVVNELDDDDVSTLLVSGTDFFPRGSNIRIGVGRYTATYTTVPVVPEDLKEAIKMEVAERYANRGENIDTSGLSKAAIAKIKPYQTVWL